MDAVLEREDLTQRLEAASLNGMTMAVWADAQPNKAAVIDPASGHKLILRLGDESWEAYDLSDRMERISVAGEDVAWVGPLRARLDSLLRHNARPPSGP